MLSSGQQQMQTDEAPDRMVSQPIFGLICHQASTHIEIRNPGLNKVLILPQIQRPAGVYIKTFFGYDNDEDVFKVLTITNTYQYQIYKVGSDKEETWRGIACKYDHSPVTEGLFKEGVLYYGARSNSDKSVVMSFNVSSEDFTVIELPEEAEIDHRRKLVNYDGDIALVNDSEFDSGIVNESNGNGVFEMWVRDEDAGNWRRERIEIPHWKETVSDDEKFYFIGTTGTREFVFATYSSNWDGRPLCVLYYDTVTTNLRRLVIGGMVDNYFVVRTFLDHVDSTWLL